jgi:hypothetical protein
VTDQYPPIRWHAPTESPRFGSSVTWIGITSAKQIDGRYDGNSTWRPDVGGKETIGAENIVQWRYRR